MRAALLASQATTIEDAQSALPAPTTSAHGVAITGWRSGSKAPLDGLLRLTGDATIALTDAYVAVYDGSTWLWLEDLATPIAMITTKGWAKVIANVGLFERVAIVGTVDTDKVTATLTPIETVQQVA